ncbi:hypothetical protein COO60DRAFT_1531066 [Scenedesmus sp. NREL 46B-D3]|nr:hypothetical protein COO60DRAFT_1531066 [Scenedesmus sp. NREL 46B-D3]
MSLVLARLAWWACGPTLVFRIWYLVYGSAFKCFQVPSYGSAFSAFKCLIKLMQQCQVIMVSQRWQIFHADSTMTDFATIMLHSCYVQI